MMWQICERQFCPCSSCGQACGACHLSPMSTSTQACQWYSIKMPQRGGVPQTDAKSTSTQQLEHWLMYMCAGCVTLPSGTEMVMPGDNVSAEFELFAPVAMEPGLRFAVREGGRTVGAGVVSKVIS